MSQTVIDGSQDWATWSAGDGLYLGDFSIVGGVNDPPEHEWGMLANSMFAYLYPHTRGAGLSVKGRAANTTGVIADIVAANDGEVMRRSGTAIGFGTVATAGLANDAVSDAKLRNSGARSVIGRAANSSGDPADISGSGTAAAPQVLTDDGSTCAFTSYSSVRLAASVLYEVNFSSLGNNTLTDGAETIDGLGWVWANTGEMGTCAVQNGTGIRMVVATSNGGAVTMTSASQLIAYGYVPLSQIAGWDPTAEYVIEIYCSARVLEANGEYVALGLWGVANSPFSGSAARMRAAKLVRNAGDTADVMRNTLNTTDDTGDVAIDSHNVIAIRVSAAGIGQVYSGIWSAGWPTSYTAHSIFPSGPVASSPMNTGDVRIFVGLGTANDASPSTSVTIERMRIRRVA